MRTIWTSALVLEPHSVNADRSSMEANAFLEGDEVVLAAGTNQGTLGIFRRLRNDINWADIMERNGNIRSHPVAWLAHSTSATPGYSKVLEERI
jgi:hypothetical protein